jgi:hypothetical protein
MLVLIAVCLAGAQLSAGAQDHQMRQAHRQLLQEDVAAATAVPSSDAATVDSAATASTLLAAVATSFDASVYPNITVQKAEEAAAVQALLTATGGDVLCPTTQTPRKARAMERRVRAWRAARIAQAQRAGISAAAAVEAAAFTSAAVQTHWHIYTSSSGAGNPTNTQITNAMTVLNQAFATAGFTFETAAVTRRSTTSSRYTASPGSSAERSNKAVRVGGFATLNIYTWAPGRNLLGWATFPSGGTRVNPSDGVVIHFGSLPGGSITGYNGGDTLVHEVSDRVWCGVAPRHGLGTGRTRADRGAGLEGAGAWYPFLAA